MQKLVRYEGNFENTRKGIHTKWTNEHRREAGNAPLPPEEIDKLIDVHDEQLSDLLSGNLAQLDGLRMPIKFDISDWHKEESKRMKSLLDSLGIEDYDFKQGTFKDKHGRSRKLTSLVSDGAPAKKDIEALMQAGLSIMFSFKGAAKATVTTGRQWTSCMRLTYTKLDKLINSPAWCAGFIFDNMAADADEYSAPIARFMFGLGVTERQAMEKKPLSVCTCCNVTIDNAAIRKMILTDDNLKSYQKKTANHLVGLKCPCCGTSLPLINTTDIAPAERDALISGKLYSPKPAIKEKADVLLKGIRTSFEEFNLPFDVVVERSDFLTRIPGRVDRNTVPNREEFLMQD